MDRVYMAFVQATTGSGGWPMTVFLTPELKPFYGGTYFPPTSRWGRPGFLDLLGELARVWKEDRATRQPRRRRAVRSSAAGDRVPGRNRDRSGDRRRGVARRRHRAVSDGVRHPLWRVRRGAEVSATRRSCCSCCASTREDGPAAAARRRRCSWRRKRFARWRSAACAITSAEGFTATLSTPSGACLTSRRCCTTRRSSRWRISRRDRHQAIRSSWTSPPTRCGTCCAT